MDIQNGKLYQNRTWKYLVPCLKDYEADLIANLTSFFKLGVGIADFNFHTEEENCIYILIGTKTLVSSDRTLQEYQERFSRFLDWLTHKYYFVADYPYDTNGKHMIVIRIPLKHKEVLDKFLAGKYSEMYRNTDINTYFKLCVSSNKKVEEERNKIITETRNILTKDKKYIPIFVETIKKRYACDAYVEDFVDAELDFPPELSEEIFNYE